MNRTHKIIGFILVVLLGAYGCSKGPGTSHKDTSPAAKVQRLEEELRAATTERDQFRQKLLAAEDQQSQLRKQLDNERKALQARTTERDSIATQYESFRKNIKDLLGQAESTLGNPSDRGTPPAIGGSTPATRAGTGTAQRN